MKSEIRSVITSICLVSAIVLLFAASATAKKGGGDIPILTPVITAEQAVGVVTAAFPKLAVGKYWGWRGPAGDRKMNVALILDDRIVSRVELNPATGEIMAKGQRIFVDQISATPEQAISRVRKAMPNLQVSSARLGKNGEWKVELTLNRGVVAEINVHSGDGSILTDWRATREWTLYSGMR